MQSQLSEEWDRAYAHFAAHLKDKERVYLSKVTCQDDLLAFIRKLHATYSGRVGLGSLSKVYALIAQLRSFTQVINIFAQASDFASIVWGPLALILEVRHLPGSVM